MYLEKITLVQRKYHFLQRNQVFKTLINLLFYRFDNEYHKGPLKSNKSLTSPFEALNIRFFEVLIIDDVYHIKKDL